MFDKTVFAERLRKLREEKGWTQKEASEKCGIVSSTYSAYENKKNAKIPSLDIATQIADGFQVSMNQLCGIEPEKHDVSDKQVELNSCGSIAKALIAITKNCKASITAYYETENGNKHEHTPTVSLCITSYSLHSFFHDRLRLASVLTKEGDEQIFETWEKARLDELSNISPNEADQPVFDDIDLEPLV